MDMYTDDLISRDELNEKIGGMRKQIEDLESELNLIARNEEDGDRLEMVLKNTFQEIEDVADVREMTNAQLKKIIQKIEVDQLGNVDIYLRVLKDFGIEERTL